MQHAFESSTPTQGSVLFGTVNGAVGENVIKQKLYVLSLRRPYELPIAQNALGVGIPLFTFF